MNKTSLAFATLATLTAGTVLAFASLGLLINERAGIVTFNLPSAHPHDVASVLDREAICVRAGHHCTMPLHDRLDEAATLRASFNVYSDRDDIDRLADGLARAEQLFARA